MRKLPREWDGNSRQRKGQGGRQGLAQVSRKGSSRLHEPQGQRLGDGSRLGLTGPGTKLRSWGEMKRAGPGGQESGRTESPAFTPNAKTNISRGVRGGVQPTVTGSHLCFKSPSAWNDPSRAHRRNRRSQTPFCLCQVQNQAKATYAFTSRGNGSCWGRGHGRGPGAAGALRALGEKPPARAPVSVPSSLVCETLIKFFFKSEIVLSSKNGSREAGEAQEHQPAGKDPGGRHPPQAQGRGKSWGSHCSPDEAPRPAGASYLDQTPTLPDRAQSIPCLRGHFVQQCQG